MILQYLENPGPEKHLAIWFDLTPGHSRSLKSQNFNSTQEVGTEGWSLKKRFFAQKESCCTHRQGTGSRGPLANNLYQHFSILNGES